MQEPLIVNNHVHTPYSFTSFDSVEQMVAMAAQEGVSVLGISDFNTVEGHAEFFEQCGRQRRYPLMNIEFIAFSQSDKEQGLRWNDPRNPGVMYFCGKGLNFPSTLSSDSRNTLAALWKGTQDQIWQVMLKLNDYLRSLDIPVSLDYCAVRSSFAKNTVRERHVARALYQAFADRWPQHEQLLAQYRTLFGNPSFQAPLCDSVVMQNEIRNRLLKAGAPAFVDEKKEAFPGLKEVVKLIIDGGGIPCYPVLADGSAPLTDYEKDVDALANLLTEAKINAVEFIPLRNDFDLLKRYVECFHRRGFCVTFGTEHNTPEIFSLVPCARGGRPFDEELLGIGYRGACIIAAHQERHRTNRSGFVNCKGDRKVAPGEMEEFVRFGDRVIRERVGEERRQ